MFAETNRQEKVRASEGYSLKWNKLKCVDREIDRLVDFICSNDDKTGGTLVVLGKMFISPYIKGHVKPPLNLLARRMIDKSKEPGSRKPMIANEKYLEFRRKDI